MIIENLGLPYMGSKRKISNEIVKYILNKNPDCKYFYDLFGGGGSVSFTAIQYNQIKKVIYNEINTGVTELLKKIQKEGITKEFYQFIDRETFIKNKDNNDWFGGLCKVIWSFGNNQRGYLFGKDIEDYKKNFHLVVTENINKLPEMVNYIETYVKDKYNISKKCFLEMPKGNNYQERRLEIRTQLNIYEKECKLSQLRNLEQLERLQQLERLEQLEQLQQLEQLEIKNLSYDLVKINTPIDETIIYLDPPYKNTGKYQHDINHDKLLNWIINSKYKIYVSSYEFDGLYKCYEIKHRSTLSSINNNKKTIESLFCNQEETFYKQLNLF